MMIPASRVLNFWCSAVSGLPGQLQQVPKGEEGWEARAWHFLACGTLVISIWEKRLEATLSNTSYSLYHYLSVVLIPGFKNYIYSVWLSLSLPEGLLNPAWTGKTTSNSCIVQCEHGFIITVIAETVHLITDQTHSFRCAGKPSSLDTRPIQL